MYTVHEWGKAARFYPIHFYNVYSFCDAKLSKTCCSCNTIASFLSIIWLKQMTCVQFLCVISYPFQITFVTLHATITRVVYSC